MTAASDAAVDSDSGPATAPPPADPPTFSEQGLRLAWREHRPYVLASTVLFLLGVVFGVVIWGRVDLFAALGFESLGDVLPQNPTATTIFLNNARVFLIFALAPITVLGILLTVAGLLFNGVLVGYVATGVTGQVGLGFVLLALAPHGILELPALFVGSAIGFRLIAVPLFYLLGSRESLWTRGELERAGLLVVLGILVLGVAAVIEMHVTTWLLEQFFPAARGAAA
ncbi:stage II sporulation protein M [Haloarchaeobius sp. TZWWS8]|uniref:stage II sporulation protein M n=1 Tax=Haloarchaeobius sp. TZWWS8 TaxID=3446121 RepID=UPI003EBF297F